jgi:hypothetical protein
MKKDIIFSVFLALFGAAVYFTDDFFYTRGAKIYPFVGLLFMIWSVINILMVLNKNKKLRRTKEKKEK